MSLTAAIRHADVVRAMRESAEKVAAFLRALANEDRMLLLCQLTQGEACVYELERLTDIRQPKLSQHLGVLRKDHLVTTRREGKRIYYNLSPGPTLEFLDVLYRNFCLDNLKNQAPSTETTPVESLP